MKKAENVRKRVRKCRKITENDSKMGHKMPENVSRNPNRTILGQKGTPWTEMDEMDETETSRTDEMSICDQNGGLLVATNRVKRSPGVISRSFKVIQGHSRSFRGQMGRRTRVTRTESHEIEEKRTEVQLGWTVDIL